MKQLAPRWGLLQHSNSPRAFPPVSLMGVLCRAQSLPATSYAPGSVSSSCSCPELILPLLGPGVCLRLFRLFSFFPLRSFWSLVFEHDDLPCPVCVKSVSHAHKSSGLACPLRGLSSLQSCSSEHSHAAVAC